MIADRYNSYNRYESCEKSNAPQLASSMTDKARGPQLENNGSKEQDPRMEVGGGQERLHGGEA